MPDILKLNIMDLWTPLQRSEVTSCWQTLVLASSM